MYDILLRVISSITMLDNFANVKITFKELPNVTFIYSIVELQVVVYYTGKNILISIGLANFLLSRK